LKRWHSRNLRRWCVMVGPSVKGRLYLAYCNNTVMLSARSLISFVAAVL
jgi:hypothetical protein